MAILRYWKHTRKGLFSIYAVISTWCWPKLPKHVADNSWLYSAPNVMLALATLKYGRIFENYFVLRFIQKKSPFCIGVPNSYFPFISKAAVFKYLYVCFPSLCSRRCHIRIETFTMTGSSPFLGALAKWRKTTISFVVLVRLSVCPHGTTRLPLDGFS